MVGIGDGFYIRVPSDSERRLLHPAKLVGLQDHIYTGELEEPDLAFEEGQNILVYYEKQREFMQQSARIGTFIQTEGKWVLGFETSGEPMSAERRQTYRVSTVMRDLTAKLGSEDACPVLDVSATGFSVVAAETLQLGNVVEASLEYEGKRYTGEVCVLSGRVLGQGRIRYGLHCVDDKKPGTNLQLGLPQVSMVLQRQQLRRLANVT